MSTSQEAPALIQYACERCKTRFVLPPSSRKLSIPGKFRALSIGLGRFFRYHEGVAAGYDTARRQLLAKMDAEAYQSFVQSFRFCHECRQFVCNECWSTSRRSCLTCVAKSMTGTVRPRPPFAPTGPEIPRPVVAAVVPRKGRLRRDVGLVALAIAIVLLSVEGGYVLIAATSGSGPTPRTILVTLRPSTTPSSTPVKTAVIAVASPTARPTPTPTASPSPSHSASPSPSATASRAVTATPTKAPVVTAPPVKTAAPTAAPVPTTPPAPSIVCSPTSFPTSAMASTTVNCSWLNQWAGSPTVVWLLMVPGSSWGYVPASSSLGPSTWTVSGTYTVYIEVTMGSNQSDSNHVTITVS